MHASKSRSLLVILGFILVAFLAWVAVQPPLTRPNVSITFLGYTNDAAGTLLAVIAVTNLSTTEIFVYRPLIEMPEPKEPAGLAYDQSHTGQFHGTRCSDKSCVGKLHNSITNKSATVEVSHFSPTLMLERVELSSEY